MCRLLIATLGVVVLGWCTSLTAQDQKTANPAQAKTDVVRDVVKGSIHHRPRGQQVEWERLTGKVQVINPSRLKFSEGTLIELGPTPEWKNETATEATGFLTRLVHDQPVNSFGYVGDTNIQHAMIINGWGLANHSSLHPAEVIARENKRGFWREQAHATGQVPEATLQVVKDRVRGALQHDQGKRVWQRIRGRVRVIDAHTLEFMDGTRVLLHVVAPDLGQMSLKEDSRYPCGTEAADFLRKLVGDQSVMCFLVEAQDDKWIGYAGDTNLGHALVINGWGLAHHSSLHAAEITAREHQRGLWRGKFVDPDDWRDGKRLPDEK